MFPNALAASRAAGLPGRCSVAQTTAPESAAKARAFAPGEVSNGVAGCGSTSRLAPLANRIVARPGGA